MNSTTEQTANAPEATASEQPKASKRANRSRRGAPVTPAKGKGGKKGKAPQGAPKAKRAAKAKDSREGSSKASTILELLKRPGGATGKELMEATGWQAHSVRGFLSGALRKKMGLTVVSAKSEAGERSYSIES